MTTPMQHQRNQRMFNAALEEFSHLGFHQASVDSIALKAGVSKATLYNHFETKEALFLAVFDTVLKTTIRPPLLDSKTLSLEAGIKLGVRHLFTQVAETPEAGFFFHCMTSDSDLLSDDLRNELSNRFIAASFGEMNEFVRAQKDGLVNPHLDLELIHHAIIGMILQAFRFWWSREKEIPVKKLADQLSEFILFGLSIPETTPLKKTGKNVLHRSASRGSKL